MLKTAFSLFLITITLNAYSQKIKSGKAIYGLTLIEKKDSESLKMMLSINPNFFNVAKEIEFELSFNSSKSLFTEKKKLYSDEQATQMALAKMSVFGNTMIRSDSVFKEYLIENIGEYIIKSELNKNWEISSETKKINDFVCYKATTELTVTNVRGVFKSQIIAWFCPEISFQYGPNGYAGLPGLILELHTKEGVFCLKKLIMNDKEEEIKNLKSLQIVTEIEYEKISVENYKKFLNSRN